jgi:hypothetical protein
VQRLKLALREKAPKTVNNVLTVFSMLLKKAAEWGVIERMPCVIKFATGPEIGGGLLRFRGIRAIDHGGANDRLAR